MVWAVSRPVLLVTPVSRIWHDDDADFDFDDADFDFDDFVQVMGLATTKQGGAPAPQVEGDQQNNDDKSDDNVDTVDAHGDNGDGDKTGLGDILP